MKYYPSPYENSVLIQEHKREMDQVRYQLDRKTKEYEDSKQELSTKMREHYNTLVMINSRLTSVYVNLAALGLHATLGILEDLDELLIEIKKGGFHI